MKWTIYRQELMLFHARHKRLRFIYEDEGEENSSNKDGKENKEFIRYRRHAQQILHTLQAHLKAFPNGAKVCFDPSNTTGIQRKESQDNSAANRKVWDLLTAEQLIDVRFQKDVKLCLKYCDKVLANEQWAADSHPRLVLKALFNDLKCDEALLDKSTVQCLISSLPFMPHWDLPGIFSEKTNVHSLLSDIRRLTFPVYAAHISDKPSAEFPKSRSKKLLGNALRLKACFSNSSDDIASTLFVRTDDFYNYCHDPRKKTEVTLYRSYGAIYDALQKLLTPRKQDVYYLAYPIKTSLGRTHFWHFYVSPENPEDADLEKLWAAWWPLHQRALEWPYLHASLAAELEQLDVGYAQGAIGAALRSPDNKMKLDGDRKAAQVSVDKLVCSHGHMLFPAKCFCLTDQSDNKMVWQYDRYNINNIAKDDTELQEIVSCFGELGHVWTGPTQSDTLCSTKCHQVGGLKFHSKHAIGNDTRSRLLAHRYRCLVEQQRYLVEEMMFAVRERDLLEKQLKEDWKAQCRQYFFQLDDIEIEKLRGAFFDGSSFDVCVPGFEKMQSAAFKKKWFENSGLSQQQEEAELLFLVSKNAHALVSEFLELNPIKMLTHRGDHFLLGWTIERAIARLNNFLTFSESLHVGVFDKRKLYNFALTARATLEKYSELTEITDDDIQTLSPLRENLQIDLKTYIGEKKDSFSFQVKNPELDHILRKPRLSLSTAYLDEVLQLGVNISTFEEKTPTLGVFRQLIRGSEHDVQLYREYCVFRWDNGNCLVESESDKLKPKLAALVSKLKNIGRCFIGSKSIDSVVSVREVKDDGALSGSHLGSARANILPSKALDSEIWPDQALVPEILSLFESRNILMLVFVSYRFEPTAQE